KETAERKVDGEITKREEGTVRFREVSGIDKLDQEGDCRYTKDDESATNIYDVVNANGYFLVIDHRPMWGYSHYTVKRPNGSQYPVITSSTSMDYRIRASEEGSYKDEWSMSRHLNPDRHPKEWSSLKNWALGGCSLL